MERDNRDNRDVQIIWEKAKKLLSQINKIKQDALLKEELYLFCKYVDNELGVKIDFRNDINGTVVGCKSTDLDNFG